MSMGVGVCGRLEGFLELLSSNSPVYDIPSGARAVSLCLCVCQEGA